MKKTNFNCKLGDLTFKEKKVSEVVKKKINDPDLNFSFNPNIEKWDYMELGKIRELNSLPELNCAYRILCNRNINAIEVLNAFNSIDSISCSFATLNQKSVDELNKYKIINLFGRVNPDNEDLYFSPLFEKIKAEHKYKITGHTKLFLIKSNDQYYTVNTSANPKGSSQFECYTIYNSKEYYEFCLNSLLDIANKKQTNKAENLGYLTQLTYLNKGGKTPIDSILEIDKNEKIKQIDFVVFSTGIKALSKLNFDSSVKMNFHISDFILKMNSQREPFNMMKSLILKHGGKIGIYNTHTKISLIRTESNYYIIDSTSNLGSNSKFEITEIRNSKDEYDFTINFLNKHFK